MRMGMHRLCAAVCLASAHGDPLAQSPSNAPISTDRPGFLFAPTVVPAGRLQFETGLQLSTLSRDSGAEERSWSLPVNVRYGLSEGLELRATLPTYTQARTEGGTGSERDEGSSDTEIGVKLALAPLAGGPFALQASLRLPTGAANFTTGEVGGTVLLLHGRDFSGLWLQFMAGVSHLPIEAAEDQTSGAFAALVSRPVGENRVAYVEATALPGLDHASGQSYLGTGWVWTPSARLQLDLSADFGLDDDSTDALVALGISWFF